MKKISYFFILISFIVLSGCNNQKRQAEKFFEGGNAQLKMGNQINAIGYFNKAIALDSTRVEFFMTRANAKLSYTDYKGATADYTKVIQLDPNRAEAYLSRGVIKIFMKEFSDEAVADLNKALQLDPTLTNAYYNIGVIKYVQHDIESACINWHKAADMGSSQAKSKVSMYCR